MQASYCDCVATTDSMITIEDVISLSLEHSATDIHLEVGTPIYIRAANGLESMAFEFGLIFIGLIIEYVEQ